MSRRRIAIVSSCAPPQAGQPVTGGGLRTLQLVESVRAAGHVPSLLVERGADPQGFDRAELPERLAKLRPSVVILEQWALASAIGDFDKPVAIDLHGSLLLENVYRRGDVDLMLDAGAKLAALARADLLLVPSPAQLSWFASWATLAGLDPRDLPLRLLPLALPGAPTKRTAKAPPLRLVYGGARWPWIDSRDALIAAADAVAGIEGATLDVFAYDPPRHGLDFDDELGTWGEVDAALGGREADGITLRGGTSHAAFSKFLRTEATVALDCWVPNPERLLAATTRTVESLHAGLPVITVPEASWAPALVAAGAGWTSDRDGLAALLKKLGRSGKAIAKASEAAVRLAGSTHSIEGAGAALTDWLERPSRAVRATPLLDRLIVLEREHNAIGVTALEEDHRRLIDAQIAAHQVELQDLKRQAAADIEAVSANHAAMVRTITDGHREENAKILTDSQRQSREQLAHWQGELERLRTALEGELRRQAERHALELKEAIGQQGSERADERDRHRAELEKQQARFEADREHHRQELEDREAKHRAAVETIVREHAANAQETRAARDGEATALVEAHRAQIAAHQVELQDLKRQAAADIEAVSANHAAMVRTITDGHREENAKILTDSQRQSREQLAHWQGELERLRTALEGELRRQAERHALELKEAIGQQGSERADERDRHRAELEKQQARFEADREHHRQELEDREAKHRAAVETIVREHAANAQETRAARDGEATALVEAHRAQMLEAKAEREAEVQQIVGQWQAELAQADAQRTAEMETADERSRAEIAAAVADWQQKLEAAHERLRAAKAKHTEEVARLRVELGAERSRAETTRAPASEQPPEQAGRQRGPALPGRSGQALRLARLWVEHALDRDA